MLFIYNIKFIYLLSKYEEENVNCKVTQWGFLIFFQSLEFTGALKKILIEPQKSREILKERR